jgi:uncharacterized protein YlaI
MITTFHCHDCKTTVQIESKEDCPVIPPGWRYSELIDGAKVWLCDHCVDNRTKKGTLI